MLDMDKRDLKVLDILSGRISIEIGESMLSSKSSEESGEECNNATMNALKDAYMLGRASLMKDNGEKILIVYRIKKYLEMLKLSITPKYFIDEGIRRLDVILEEFKG